MVQLSLLSCSLLFATGLAQLSSSSLKSYPNVLDLGGNSFGPVKPAYWTSLPHHRRTPFAVSPDGKSAYLAYLDKSETDVHIQSVNPSTFEAVGTPVTVTGAKEAGGLVAKNDGFTLLTNIAMTGVTTDAPPGNTPVPIMVRYKSGKEAWRTWLGGPSVHAADGLSMAPDLNGDIVWSEAAQLYGAYFVVTDYKGFASGHFGDSIQYVDDSGALKVISGASSSWGCSHNTGIAFETADKPPYASICAEDHGSIWLNTNTRSMSGIKIANENTTNGGSGEPMGGMSGSYSNLALYPGTTSYIFAWATRGAMNLVPDTWMGGNNVQSSPRTLNHQVGIAMMSAKDKLVGPQAISQAGAASGDDQLVTLTSGANDHTNIHVEAFSSSAAMVTWEEITSPSCTNVAMGCSGTYSGTYFQQVDAAGKKVGSPISSQTVYVAGDIARMPDGRLCWPYVDMKWSLSSAVGWGGYTASTTKMSFACLSAGGASSDPVSSSAPAASSSAAPSATTAQTFSWSSMSVSVRPSTSAAPVPSSSASAPPVSTVTVIPIPSTSDIIPLPSFTRETSLSGEPSLTVTRDPSPSAEPSLSASRSVIDPAPTTLSTVNKAVDASTSSEPVTIELPVTSAAATAPSPSAPSASEPASSAVTSVEATATSEAPVPSAEPVTSGAASASASATKAPGECGGGRRHRDHRHKHGKFGANGRYRGFHAREVDFEEDEFEEEA